MINLIFYYINTTLEGKANLFMLLPSFGLEIHL